MTTPVKLELVWAESGGTSDPTDAKYQLGWVSEIPTYQNFNYVLNALDKAKLSYAESDSYPWQDLIAYKAGARVERAGKIYYCILDHNDSIGSNPQDPELDTTRSYWVSGTVFSMKANAFNALTDKDGVLIDNINQRDNKTLWEGNDVTISNSNAVIALNTTNTLDDNFLFGNVNGKIVVVNVGAHIEANGVSLLPTSNVNSFELYHEGHKPTQAEVAGTIPSNPLDGVLYGRRNGNWVKVTAIDVQPAPPPPVEGNGSGWYNLDDGTFYIDINDGDSSQWVPASPPIVPVNFDDTLVTADSSTEPRDLSARFADVTNAKDFGLTGNGTTDCKAITEQMAALSKSIYFPSSKGEVYFFSAAPTVPDGVTCRFDRAGAFTGTVTADELNALIIEDGILYGYPASPELRGNRVEFICGTFRQQQPRTITIVKPAGTTAFVTEIGHGREVGDLVVVRGATPSGYNGTLTIGFIDDADSYRVSVDSNLASPPTGSITAFGADVWEWIVDESHVTVGIDSTKTIRSDSSGYGLLLPMLKTYTKVLTMCVSPDETLAGAQGMVIGPSVSTNAIALRASLNKTVAGNVYYDGSLWKTSMGTDQGKVYTYDAPYPFPDINYTSGNLKLEHSFCLGSDVRLSPHSRGGAVVPFIPVVKSINDNGATLNFMHVNAGALDVYTGAASTSMSFQFSKNSNRLIKFDGSDRSSETSMFFGNVWISGYMLV